jgi:hypothetical protein
MVRSMKRSLPRRHPSHQQGGQQREPSLGWLAKATEAVETLEAAAKNSPA